MNEFKKIGIEFINAEPIAKGAEEWIIRLMSGQPLIYTNVENANEIIRTLNEDRQYLNGDYKVIKQGIMATLVQFDNWEIQSIADSPYMQNETWTYEAARAEYDAEYNNDDEEA